MSQAEYEAIIKCIHFAMPIAENELVTALNRVVNNSNKYLDIQEAQKAKATKTVKTTKKTKKGE